MADEITHAHIVGRQGSDTTCRAVSRDPLGTASRIRPAVCDESDAA